MKTNVKLPLLLFLYSVSNATEANASLNYLWLFCTVLSNDSVVNTDYPCLIEYIKIIIYTMS